MKEYLIEFIKRFALKSPKFFQILQYAGIAMMIVSGIPYALQQVNNILTEANYKPINLPKIIEVLSNKAITVGALITWIMAKLPATSNTKPLTSDDKRAAPEDVLPFTTKSIEEGKK